MIGLTVSALVAIAPMISAPYQTAFLCADTALVPYGIPLSRLRWAHWLSQILHESSGLQRITENLNYSSERLMAVWPSRFPTLSSTKPYSHNPESLANYVYGGRLGNTEPGDGWRYIGRGAIQLTGKDNYRRASEWLGVDFVAEPELVAHPAYVLHVAGAFWKHAGCNAMADQDDVLAVTRAINGGIHGLASRRRWLEKTKAMMEIS